MTAIETPHTHKAAGHIRHAFIDNAKAIAIVLVAFGHAPALPPAAKAFIYSFHIPLFYFLSGCLMSRDKLQAPVRNFLRYIGRTLLIPYVFFFILSFVSWLVLKHVAPQRDSSDVSTVQALLGLFTGTEESLVVNKVLWFLPCLMVVSVGYYLLRKKASESVIAALALATALIGCFALPHLPARLPFGVDCALVALAYYACGQLFRAHAFPLPLRLHSLAAGFLILLLLTICLSQWNGVIDLSKLDFGRNPFAYLGCSYLGIVMALFAARMIPANPPLKWLSANTLVIFPTHTLMFAVFTGALTIVLHIPKEMKDGSVLFTFGYAALAIALAYPLAYILRKLFPWALGSYRAQYR